MRGFLLFMAILLCSLGHGQAYAKWIELAKEAESLNDHQGAVRYFMEAYALDSSRAELQYDLAEAHHDNHQYSMALRFYQKVYRKERGRYYPEGAYHIAEMYTYLGNYEAALEFWKRAMRHAEGDEALREDIERKLRSMEFALLHQDEAENVTIEQLGPRVNGPESDFGAFLLPDSSLLFSSLRGPYTNALVLERPDTYFIRPYRAEWIKGTWKKTQAMYSSYFNSEFHYANPMLDESGKWLYISECVDLSHCVIARFPWEDGITGPLELLNGDFLTSDSSHTHPFPFRWQGQDMLLFSSDREGTQGGMDLWLAMEEEGEWRVQNLGSGVNSPGHEVSPSFIVDSNAVYFSSDHYPGFGGFDIFKAQGFPELRTEPENMGLPLNSSLNDLYFRWQGDWGFLSSNRSSAYSIDGAQCCSDLFMVKQEKEVDSQDSLSILADSLVQVTPILVPDEIQDVSELKDLLPLSLYFHNDRPDPRSMALATEQDYRSTLEDYTSLRQTYLDAYSEGLEGSAKSASEAQMNAFFDEQLVQQLEVLDKVSALLLRELEDGKQIEVVIKGFASPLAESDYNKRLTERRISSVVNYFSNSLNMAFRPYMSPEEGEARFLIRTIPYGEEKSEKAVSDNAQDRKSSVYSLAAARERRVEILRINEVR